VCSPLLHAAATDHHRQVAQGSLGQSVACGNRHVSLAGAIEPVAYITGALRFQSEQAEKRTSHPEIDDIRKSKARSNAMRATAT
jgi:hypothetical protein